MKLSKKGLQRLSHKTTHPSTDGTYRCRPIGHEQVYALESFEFHSDDFVDCVVLTLEEAKGIYETIEEAKEFLWKYHKVPLTKLGQKDFDTLKERILQAEKQDGQAL